MPTLKIMTPYIKDQFLKEKAFGLRRQKNFSGIKNGIKYLMIPINLFINGL